MQNESYQVVVPVSTTTRHQIATQGESMTFGTELARNRYIREQRAYGWEVFLNYMGVDHNDRELYSVTRRALS